MLLLGKLPFKFHVLFLLDEEKIKPLKEPFFLMLSNSTIQHWTGSTNFNVLEVHNVPIFNVGIYTYWRGTQC